MISIDMDITLLINISFFLINNHVYFPLPGATLVVDTFPFGGMGKHCK